MKIMATLLIASLAMAGFVHAEDNKLMIKKAELKSVRPASNGMVYLIFKACLAESPSQVPVASTPVTITRGDEMFVRTMSDTHGCVSWLADFIVTDERTMALFEIKPDYFPRGKIISFGLNTSGTDLKSVVLDFFKE